MSNSICQYILIELLIMLHLKIISDLLIGLKNYTDEPMKFLKLRGSNSNFPY